MHLPISSNSLRTPEKAFYKKSDNVKIESVLYLSPFQGATGDYLVVECCLQWIHGRTCLGSPNRIKHIYEVEGLMQELHAHIGNQVSKSGCVDALTSHDWDYEPDTR